MDKVLEYSAVGEKILFIHAIIIVCLYMKVINSVDTHTVSLVKCFYAKQSHSFGYMK